MEPKPRKTPGTVAPPHFDIPAFPGIGQLAPPDLAPEAVYDFVRNRLGLTDLSLYGGCAVHHTRTSETPQPAGKLGGLFFRALMVVGEVASVPFFPDLGRDLILSELFPQR